MIRGQKQQEEKRVYRWLLLREGQMDCWKHHHHRHLPRLSTLPLLIGNLISHLLHFLGSLTSFRESNELGK